MVLLCLALAGFYISLAMSQYATRQGQTFYSFIMLLCALGYLVALLLGTVLLPYLK